MKRTLSLLLALVMLASLAVTASGADIAAALSDSANQKLTAPYEDDTLDLWFDHSFTKVEQKNTTSSGLYTYTMRMARNEIEDCQFFLASYVGHEELSVEVSDFVGPDILPTELFWEHYVQMGKKGTLPDPLIPYEKAMTIKPNRVQAFVVKVKTDKYTPAGDYKATVNVTSSDGKLIKTAEISLHVWDFTLPEETSVKTLFGLDRGSIYSSYNDPQATDGGALYALYYDFLLENRICAYDLPYPITDERADKYLDNPRVNSFIITGYNADKSDEEIREIYKKLSSKDEWFEKGIFYYVDEPVYMDKLNQIASVGERLEKVYPDYKMISPYFLNYEYDGKDAISIMEPYINVWCTKINAWTPQGRTDPGAIHMLTDEQIAKHGTYAERMAKQVADGDENWDYFCWEPVEPYCTFDASHQGIEQRIAFWQSYDFDVDGLLYFAVNESTGWRNLEKINAGGIPVYGDGTMLYYGSLLNQVKQTKRREPVSSTRIENIRDGIEDYMYLELAERLCGKEKVDAIVAEVTPNVLDWTRDDDVLQNARNMLGDMIEAASESEGFVPDALEFVGDCGYSLSGGVKVVRGVSGNVTAAHLVSRTVGGEGVWVYSPDGKVLAAGDLVFDGCMLRLYDGGVLIDEATVRVMGDVNSDGAVNARDVIAIMRAMVGWDEPYSAACADVNGDGKLNARDIILIIKKMLGADVEFVFPEGADFEYTGTKTALLYTDVPADDVSAVNRRASLAELGGDASVNFALTVGQAIDKIKLSAYRAAGGEYSIRLMKVTGGTAAEVETFTGTLADSEERQELVLSPKEECGPGLYSLIVDSASGIDLVERNAVIRQPGFFSGVGGVDTGCTSGFEATLDFRHGADFELSEDLNFSSMLRPVEYTVKIPGLKREYSFLHVTDTHLTLSYEEELNTTERREEQNERNAAFTAVTGINSADRFPYYLRYAKELGVDRLVLSGDIVDYASKKNVDTAFRDNLELCGIPYTYCFGNHDWSFRWCYITHSARKRYADPMFTKYMGGDNYYEEIEYDDFILVSMDNSVDTVRPEELAKFKATNEKGKPVVLMLHVPFWSQTLEGPTRAAWGGRNILIGPGTDLTGYGGATKELYEYIESGASNTAAIIAGHVHFNHVDMVGNVPQIVTGDGYEGFTRLISLVPGE